MKTPHLLLTLGLAVIAIASGLPGAIPGSDSFVDANALHDGVDYHRYLLERDVIGDELKAWKTKWNVTAVKNGWMPKPKNQTATNKDIEEDHRQRFYLAKQLVQKLKTQNPLAEFSTDSPFTLLTTDEFSAYAKNSFLAAKGTRQLREEPEPETARSPPTTSRLRSLATTDAETDRRLAASTANSPGKPSTPAATRPTPNAVRPTPVTPATTRSATQPPTTQLPKTQIPPTQPPVTTPVDAKKPGKPTTPTAMPTITPTSAPSTAPTAYPTYSPTATPTTTPTGTPSPTTAGPSRGWSVGNCMAPVQNQGMCGSCWAFASVAAVESAQCIAQGGTAFTKLSEQTLTSCDSGNSGCNGGVPLYAMQYIQQNGLCTLASDPYTASSGVLASCNTACTKVITAMKSVQSLAQTESALLTALSQRPVVVALQAGNDAWKQYKSGVLSVCPSATASIDHAVVAVGYDATTVKIRNSWGPLWGEAGYIRLARSTTANLGTCKMFQQMTVATF